MKKQQGYRYTSDIPSDQIRLVVISAGLCGCMGGHNWEGIMVRSVNSAWIATNFRLGSNNSSSTLFEFFLPPLLVQAPGSTMLFETPKT